MILSHMHKFANTAVVYVFCMLLWFYLISISLDVSIILRSFRTSK